MADPPDWIRYRTDFEGCLARIELRRTKKHPRGFFPWVPLNPAKAYRFYLTTRLDEPNLAHYLGTFAVEVASLQPTCDPADAIKVRVKDAKNNMISLGVCPILVLLDPTNDELFPKNGRFDLSKAEDVKLWVANHVEFAYVCAGGAAAASSGGAKPNLGSVARPYEIEGSAGPSSAAYPVPPHLVLIPLESMRYRTTRKALPAYWQSGFYRILCQLRSLGRLRADVVNWLAPYIDAEERGTLSDAMLQELAETLMDVRGQMWRPGARGASGSARKDMRRPYVVNYTNTTDFSRPLVTWVFSDPILKSADPCWKAQGPFLLQLAVRESETTEGPITPDPKSGTTQGVQDLYNELQIYDLSDLYGEPARAPAVYQSISGLPSIDSSFLDLATQKLSGAPPPSESARQDREMVRSLAESQTAREPHQPTGGAAGSVADFLYLGLGDNDREACCHALIEALSHWGHDTQSEMLDVMHEGRSEKVKRLTMSKRCIVWFATRNDALSDDPAPKHIFRQLGEWWTAVPDLHPELLHADSITITGFSSKLGDFVTQGSGMRSVSNLNLRLRQDRAWKTATALQLLLQDKFAARGVALNIRSACDQGAPMPGSGEKEQADSKRSSLDIVFGWPPADELPPLEYFSSTESRMFDIATEKRYAGKQEAMLYAEDDPRNRVAVVEFRRQVSLPPGQLIRTILSNNAVHLVHGFRVVGRWTVKNGILMSVYVVPGYRFWDAEP